MHAAAVLQENPAVARLDNLDAHAARLDELLRNDRARQRISMALVVAGNSSHAFVQLKQREALSFRVCHEGMQGRRIKLRVADDLNRIHQKRRGLRQISPVFPLDRQPRSRGWGRRRSDRLHLLQDRAGVRGRRRCKRHRRGDGEQQPCEPARPDTQPRSFSGAGAKLIHKRSPYDSEAVRRHSRFSMSGRPCRYSG